LQHEDVAVGGGRGCPGQNLLSPRITLALSRPSVDNRVDNALDDRSPDGAAGEPDRSSMPSGDPLGQARRHGIRH
jgi:hypothetical protein